VVDKDVRRMLEKAEAAGWRIREGKHFVCYSPDGKSRVTVPKTPSDRRSLLNVRSDFRRAGLDL